MHQEWLENGCLRIWLTDAEATEIGIIFDKDDRLPSDGQLFAVKTAVSRLLSDAIRQRPRLINCSWEVEALPIDGGCILLCTPRRVRAVRRRAKEQQPFVLHLKSVDSLFELARGLRRSDNSVLISDSSLFALGDEYRLIIRTAGGSLPPFFREYAAACDEGAAAAAAVEEHGKPLALRHALQTIADAL
ncbi:MAG: hypothetical protein ACI39E_00175 [Acutalibacteraceae bacterium]